MLAGEHALMIDLRARIMLTEVRMGGLSDARAALDKVAECDRDRTEVRIPAAAIYIAEGSPEEAIELLAPVTEGSVESLIPTWAAIHALLFDAAAHEEIGDRCAAEASLERALCSPPGCAQRGRAACHQISAEQPPGAGDRLRTIRFDEHDQDAPAPHLRQAGCSQPRRGRRPRPGAQAPSTVPSAPLETEVMPVAIKVTNSSALDAC
jgi:tetratricopeptide (TPR) repeat protein